ncbi:uracil-DNA glycosylase family protein [Autumnicola psychrophila]|uniref:Uracil-DNA glycosylase family protein n=1 Tax=Autumnicola psychrophila TaxID=3075592 RepID=A0ABU3DVX5_9FLAO|nr:uracil-DNA glycosylase family protein [Zunongwangia sp. F225]MDT0687871.1 uracil-DNA glycosylase family protein [Zunongwangia sp. F225]
MRDLLKEIRRCDLCRKNLPFEPRPILEASSESKIVLISQAPGQVVHNNRIAWNDQSGKRLREWLGVDKFTFYNTSNFAILPMGMCYPGKAKTGDAPPRKECAPLWHKKVLSKFDNLKMTILIGSYASNYYLKDKNNLTQKVANFRQYLPEFFPIPHPSPVNIFWRKKNPWFEDEVVPELQKRVKEIIE